MDEKKIPDNFKYLEDEFIVLSKSPTVENKFLKSLKDQKCVACN